MKMLVISLTHLDNMIHIIPTTNCLGVYVQKYLGYSS